MRTRLRLAFLGLLLATGVGLIVALYSARLSTPLESTLASSFQLLGTPVKLADRLASRVIPVGDLDERDLGDTYRARYDAQVVPGDVDQAYVDALMAHHIVPFAAKPFPYRAYVIPYGAPNAMALPGGVILVTRELLATLGSEAELVSVLAHELGHIESGHCFDAVRFELLARKVNSDELGALADAAAQLMLHHAYGKTTENEADDFAYLLMTNSRYDPQGMGNAFASLRQWLQAQGVSTPQQADPLRDYFLSHPPLELREAEFRQRATAWWARNAQQQRYIGRQNLTARQDLGVLDVDGEWTTG